MASAPTCAVPFDVREVARADRSTAPVRRVQAALRHPARVRLGARMHGFPVGILANNGILFSEEAQKGAQFIELCNQHRHPALFLQNITGFMVGTRYEQGGIIKHGAKLINAVSNSTVPHLTMMVGASYGAGNYGMCGRAYDPRFVFTWPNHRIAVMGRKQLAGVHGHRRPRRGRRARRAVDEQKLALKTAMLEAQIERSRPRYFATGRLWDDGIIDPRDTRTVLAIALSAAHSHAGRGRPRYGVCRTDEPPPADRESRRDRRADRRRPTRDASGIDDGRRVRRARPQRRSTSTPSTSPWRSAEPHARPSRTSTRRTLCCGRAARAPTRVHPGYGFLAENGGVRRVRDRRRADLGRADPGSIRLLGDKVGGEEGGDRGRGVPTTSSATTRSAADRRRPPRAVAAAGMRIVGSASDELEAALSSGEPRGRGGLRRRLRCSSSAYIEPVATSRCRSSATRTATSSTSASASARSSAATRRSSRRAVAGHHRRDPRARCWGGRGRARAAVGYVERRHRRVPGR